MHRTKLTITVYKQSYPHNPQVINDLHTKLSLQAHCKVLIYRCYQQVVHGLLISTNVPIDNVKKAK